VLRRWFLGTRASRTVFQSIAPLFERPFRRGFKGSRRQGVQRMHQALRPMAAAVLSRS
jgi:hypothetical protein